MLEGLDMVDDDGVNEDDNETLQRQVLFVPKIKEGEDLSAPPMDGFEFLKRVVEEARRCEPIVVKMVDTKPQKNIGKEIPEFPEEQCYCRPEMCMDKETQLHAIASFSELRSRYEARRCKISKDDMKKLQEFVKTRKGRDGWLRIFQHKPQEFAGIMGLHNTTSIELCLAIKQPKISSILEYMEEWIPDGDLSIALACQWIYTLMACIELPLNPDLCATLRGIARALISHRSKLEDIKSEELPHINLVICIIGRYFRQLDLADPMDS